LKGEEKGPNDRREEATERKSICICPASKKRAGNGGHGVKRKKGGVEKSRRERLGKRAIIARALTETAH